MRTQEVVIRLFFDDGFWEAEIDGKVGVVSEEDHYSITESVNIHLGNMDEDEERKVLRLVICDEYSDSAKKIGVDCRYFEIKMSEYREGLTPAQKEPNRQKSD